MAGQPYKSREEVELALLAFELTERRFALFRQAVLLLIVVVSAVVTTVCALRGYAWPVPSLASSPGIASAAALAVGNGRQGSGG
jgi:hypothetical protein